MSYIFIDIIGGTKRERALVEKAVYFSKTYLLPRHRNIEVNVKLVKKMKVDADVISGDDDREYNMRIRSGQSEEDLLTSVFHEFVHIKQDVRKEHNLFEANCSIDYLDRPWEIEAFELQEVMLEKYKKLQ